MHEKHYQLADEAATEALGSELSKHCESALLIALEGELGMGKTTFSRGFIRGLGHSGTVKSPTYALVEPYELAPWRVFHFDLYRLHDPEELEFMGIRDYFAEDCLCLVEWPQRGEGILPPADVNIIIEAEGAGRRARVTGLTENGRKFVQKL
ncbi:tRNA (adenosine(37)-N6)-threonylcarbamoyltransferase complex ATPase subunit type 1 TsaE [Aliidiomarina minuta]|uniref:tRNA threonylcarbamoyladenosine biosynthesis protein TsaE n=1 Tax=Aliidiomarina minuta TaxID=880057 RepID=A0A432W9A7_9GAMM|nr:tRNA (adenosine(37)-N6)-threonylcarbamoyltransferase complex ATPase subunit type 1 TsaE [Aliidiomarina minuta]RUO26737.1 tRNA (adenosine(37)-N6)-threonylcarbamoyltransferase complex ATPase subunit type 1 TsaE [Aliidiomarina minuta]